MNLLIIGVTGMPGNTLLRFFAMGANSNVFGTVRSPNSKHYFAEKLAANSITNHELEGNRSLICCFLAQQRSVKGFNKAIYSGFLIIANYLNYFYGH